MPRSHAFGLTETGRGAKAEVELTAEQGRRLANSDAVSATPLQSGRNRWRITSARKVGTVRVGDIEIYIKPKLTIARLLFLAGYAQNGVAWQAPTVSLAEAPGLVPAFAQILWRQVEQAIHQGLLPGYVMLEETLPMLRGRLRESAQLHGHHGLPLPLEICHDEFTFDIPENQILRAACECMLAVPRIDAESQRMLRYLLRSFTGVSPLNTGEPLPDWQPTRLNTRYHTALRLAGLVLRFTSPEHGRGDVQANGFLLDMPGLFEDFITVALREALTSAHGGLLADQDTHHLDDSGIVKLRPDLVWKLGGTPAAVIDAKYKAEKNTRYPNADLYQMLAYCTVLGLRSGHLIYAKGNEEPAHHFVRGSGIEIVCHAIDLDTEPEALLAQIRDLAEEIAATRQSPSAAAPSLR
jgi:5-methylcytosine-specific restriction enzyme subunit McrC